MIHLLEFAASILAAFELGQWLPRPRPGRIKTPKAVCRGCWDNRSFHEDGTGPCRYQGCRCQAYDGPEPLPPEYFAPEIS